MDTITILLHEAAPFIASLVQEGLRFSAVQKEDKLVITLTGGF